MFLNCLPRRRPSASPFRDECAIKRNPFLIDLVIGVMLEEADVKTLKTLRKMNSNWNTLDLKELEKRALGGQMMHINFSREGCPDNGYAQFIDSTAAIPQLFHSFKLHIPNSFNFIHTLIHKYTPIFLHFQFHEKTKWTEDVKKYLRQFFSSISKTLQELKVEKVGHPSSWEQVTDLISIPGNGSPLVFNKLTKITWDMGPDCDVDNHIPFQFILDKCNSNQFDPTPNLTTLEACINSDLLNLMNIGPNLSRWTQLTTLRILEPYDEDAILPATLLSLGQGGMCLKVLALSIASPLAESYPAFWENWSYFFETQAKSLRILELQWQCGFDEFDTEDFELPKIHLPRFKSLHTLHFHFSCGVFTLSEPVQPLIFEMGGFREHFPKVVHMRVNEQALLNIFPVGGVTICLKSLIIEDEPDNWEDWTSRIRSVEFLTCPARFFKAEEEEVPWKRSLMELVVENVRFPIKVSHLKCLRKLVIREWNLDIKIRKDPPYLKNFKQVPRLKLSDITFECYQEPSAEVKARFNSHFRAPVKFQRIGELQFPFYHYAI